MDELTEFIKTAGQPGIIAFLLYFVYRYHIYRDNKAEESSKTYATVIAEKDEIIRNQAIEKDKINDKRVTEQNQVLKEATARFVSVAERLSELSREVSDLRRG